MTTIIHFSNVGRAKIKSSWSQVLPGVFSLSAVAAAACENGNLKGLSITALLPENSFTGLLMVDRWRYVGEFTIEQNVITGDGKGDCFKAVKGGEAV